MMSWLPDPSSFAGATWLFARGFGLTCVVAFVSLLTQTAGLFGSRGIRPLADQVDQLDRSGIDARRVPSVFWRWSTDTAMWAVAWTGLVASVLVTVDVLTVPALLVVYVTYLSFVTVGSRFLSYQWDALLLDTVPFALLAAAVDPVSLTPLTVPATAPPVAVVLALWFFALRFMVSSGLAKIASGDQTWRDLTALTYHHQTQPLPTRLAWYAHQLPVGVHKATTAVVLAIEMGVPVLLFVPGPTRLVAVGLLVALQVAIVASGNYGFFNLLTLVLFVPAVPDRLFAWLLPAAAAGGAGPPSGWLVVLLTAVAGVLVVLHGARLTNLAGRTRWSQRLFRMLGSFRLAGRYGLFAVMTTERPELVAQASDDGETWHDYRFRYKPDDPARPPRFNAPHQPRLDWQLWFAALGTAWNNRWLALAAQRLLEGSRPVARLFADTPFDHPPRHIRVVAYEYRFTDPTTRRDTGRWWERDYAGIYLPAMSLEGAPTGDRS